MKTIKSILFIQLPLVDHSMGYIQGNVPYAAATLTGYIRQQIGANCEVEQLPYMISNFASNMVILQYIKEKLPNVICFTTYLWNLERNLSIAAAVKRESPATLILFGGPEIAVGSAAFHDFHPYVDYFVCGEGEWFFMYLFTDKAKLVKYTSRVNDNILVTQPADELISAEKIVEPFTAGFLEPMPDSSIFLEMTRGCPYRCSYCYYSKNCFHVRELPFENLLKALDEYERISEIYILSPTFDRSKDFIQKLKMLKARNFGISLHTEMCADRIDAKIAWLLKAAGFNSMELGLQTLNSEVLNNVRRHSDPEAELRGMVHLKNADIDLKIGIIPGLPHESAESFETVIDRLVSLGFASDIELYPLMILPGTAIRDEADSQNVSYQNKPPYFYTGGWGMDSSSISALTKKLELNTGFGQSVIALPYFAYDTPAENGLVKAVFFDGNNASSWQTDKYLKYIETACFDFHITCENAGEFMMGFPKLLAGLPTDNLYTFIIYGDTFFDEEKLMAIAEQFAKESVTTRMAFFNSLKDSLSFRFFQLFKNINHYDKAWRSYNFIDPVLQIEAGTAETALGYLRAQNAEEHFAVAGKSLPVPALNEMFLLYKDCPDMVAFMTTDAQKSFCELNDAEYTETGFDFKCVKM